MSQVARRAFVLALTTVVLGGCRVSLEPPTDRSAASTKLASDRGSYDGAAAEPCHHRSARATAAFFCDDFSVGNADRWSSSGGLWAVADGRCLGEGTDEQLGCGEFPTNQTIIRHFQARHVEIELDMMSIARVDKILVLRSIDPDNQIEVNFRAERPDEFPADLVVQERSECAFTLLTPEFSVLIPPHQVGESIHVRVQLVHDRLRVWIDGMQVLNRSFPFAVRRGALGVGVVGGGVTAFDNVFVHRLGDGMGEAKARPFTPRTAASRSRGP